MALWLGLMTSELNAGQTRAIPVYTVLLYCDNCLSKRVNEEIFLGRKLTSMQQINQLLHYNVCIIITQYSSTVYIRDCPGCLALCVYSVLKEILMITFSQWYTAFLTNSMHRCAQKVLLVKKWVNYMPRKGAKLEKANFRIILLLLVLVQLVYLTNRSTDKHETWWRDVTL